MTNLPLYLLSFEMDSQDELIQLLEEPRSYEKYTSGENYGRYKPLISDAVVSILEQYRYLCKMLNKKPSIELLKKNFPTLKFEGVVPLKYEQLREIILIDIAKLIQKDKSYQLMNLSTRVNNEGLSSDIIDEIAGLTKVEETSESYVSIFENIEEIYNNASVEKGIPTGIVQIDEKTGGLQPGTFNCLAGFAGAGKTTAAVNIAYNAMKEGKNVCYITLEVPKVDMSYNFLSRYSFENKFSKPISHSIIKKKELSKSDREYLFKTIMPSFKEELEKHIYILDETDFTAYTFKAFEAKIRECDSLAQRDTGRGIDLLVVDQAQLLKFGGGVDKAGNETSVINLYVSFFRQQAINFLHSKRPCTVLMLSQINRDGFNYASKHQGKYSLTNLAEANELERASAIVIALYTDESLKASKQVSIQMLKSRNGETIVEPVLSFMDPAYYVFGKEGNNVGAVFDGDTSSIFGFYGKEETAMDLSAVTSGSSETIDFNNMQTGTLI